MSTLADPAEISRALALLIAPGQVTELRGLDAVESSWRKPHTVSGYFVDPLKLTRAAAGIAQAKGIYIVVNPIDTALLARAANRVRGANSGEATGDKDILSRHWLLIDADPVRPSGISATAEEHECALSRIRAIRDFLAGKGWPAPIMADSGNGGHLLYRIGLPNNELAKQLIECCLRELGKRFDDAQVKIDQTVSNAARIWKLYGTVSRKGDHVPDRPHRLSRIIESPANCFADLQVVPVELLDRLAGSSHTGAESNTGSDSRNAKEGNDDGNSDAAGFNLADWIKNHLPEAAGPETWDGTGRKWVLPVCPFDPSHTSGSACIVERSGGKIGFKCHHNSCRGKNWRQLREKLEPGCYDSRKGDTPESREPWPESLAEPAYHGLAGEIVRAIEPHTESDNAALLIQLLVAVGSIVGRNCYLQVGGSQHFPNLFANLVGTSAKGRKGSGWAAIMNLLNTVAPDWAAERVEDGLSSGEGLIWAVRDKITKREPLKEKGHVVGYQEIEVDPGVSDKRLLVMEGEFSQALKVIRREGNTLSPVIRRAWDSGKLSTLTKNSPAKATNAHISIVGHITGRELGQLLDATESSNGFANRFLWICVRRSKCLPDGGAGLCAVDFSSIVRRLSGAVEFGRERQLLARDRQANQLWEQVYPELSAGRSGLLGAVTARAEAQVLRLSMVYAILDCSPWIKIEHLRAALAVWNYADESARYIFGRSLGDRIADRILAALREAAPEGMTRNDLREHFHRHVSSEQIDRSLSLLEAEALAHSTKEADTGGRPAIRWFAGQAAAPKAPKAPYPSSTEAHDADSSGTYRAYGAYGAGADSAGGEVTTGGVGAADGWTEGSV